MDAPARRRDAADAAPDSSTDAPNGGSIVTCHQTSPGRVVLTERKNTDGWIASDRAVELEP